MQRKDILFSTSVFIITLSVIIFPGYCQTADNAFEQLGLELKQEDVSDEFIKISESSVKRMITSDTF